MMPKEKEVPDRKQSHYKGKLMDDSEVAMSLTGALKLASRKLNKRFWQSGSKRIQKVLVILGIDEHYSRASQGKVLKLNRQI